jgi:hypothetical protein
MYCPECGREYREGYDTCSECQVPLVAALPAEPEHPDFELVTVLENSDPAVIALAESLLLEESIPYLKKFDQVQDFFAMGRLMGFNPVVGPVVIQVPEEHAEKASEMLGDLRNGNLQQDGDALEAMET